jgi:hypothetical protein
MNDYVAGLIAGKITLIRTIFPSDEIERCLGMTSTLVVHPIDTLKVTMQYHSTHSIPKATKLILQLNSVRLYDK